MMMSEVYDETLVFSFDHQKYTINNKYIQTLMIYCLNISNINASLAFGGIHWTRM